MRERETEENRERECFVVFRGLEGKAAAARGTVKIIFHPGIWHTAKAKAMEKMR